MGVGIPWRVPKHQSLRTVGDRCIQFSHLWLVGLKTFRWNIAALHFFLESSLFSYHSSLDFDPKTIYKKKFFMSSLKKKEMDQAFGPLVSKLAKQYRFGICGETIPAEEVNIFWKGRTEKSHSGDWGKEKNILYSKDIFSHLIGCNAGWMYQHWSAIGWKTKINWFRNEDFFFPLLDLIEGISNFLC